MFENLKIESELTVTTVTQSLKGNPFTIKAVIGTSNGKFTGASFIEVLRGKEVVSAGAMCNNYGIEHQYSGEDADKLSELCSALTEAITEKYGVTFLEREEPTAFEEPTPPEPESLEGGSEESIGAGDVGSVEDILNGGGENNG